MSQPKAVAPSPCEGACQVGITHDYRAVWRRGDELFMVIHGQKDVAHIVPVTESDIVTRRDPPKSWESMLKPVDLPVALGHAFQPSRARP